MFGIQKYFSIATAIALAGTMIVVGVFFHSSANRDLVELTGTNNIALANTLSVTLVPQIPELLHKPEEHVGHESARREQIEYLNAVFADLDERASLLKVKIYAPDGATLYSSDNEEIGSNRLEEEHAEVFAAALKDGAAQSGLSFEDRISAFSGEVFNRDVVETYFPLFGEDQQVVAVLELYTDVTEARVAIDSRTILAILGLCVVFGGLYFILVFGVMRRVMTPIHLASDRAAMIRPQESSMRLPTEGMPIELSPLVLAINDALDRLDNALTRHRQFTADAAHELLTPLSVLKANVDTMSDPAVREALQQDIDSISEVVSQLLELAELDSLDTGQTEAVDLRAVCEEVVAMIAPLAIRQKKEIELTGAPGPVPVRSCAKLLARAVRNLLENAVSHTPEGTVVRLELQESGSLRVMDSGPGVAVEDRPRIFQRFWRGKGRKGPGAGLGLAIVKRFASAFGGSVEVGDAPGGGAEFVLQLPLAEGPATHSTE